MIDYKDEVEGVDPFLARDLGDAGAVEINAIPDRGLKVEAATLSLLQPDDQNALLDYQNTMGRPSAEIPLTIERKIESSRKRFDDAYAKALIPILSDPNLTMDEKQNALETQRNGRSVPTDPASTLFTEALIAPSSGESISAADVRTQLSNRLDSVNTSLRQIQEIENSVRTEQNGAGRKLFEALEMFLPGEGGITAGRIAKKLYSDNSITAAAALLPGSARKELSDSIRNMPIEARVEFARQLAPIVAESSGILTNKSQLRINQWLTEVVRGDVSAIDKWTDNIFNVLDLTGIGSLLTAVPEAARAAKASYVTRKTAQMDAEASRYVTRTDPTLNPDNGPVTSTAGQAPLMEGVNGEAVVSAPRVGSNIEKLEAAEREYSSLLGQTSGKLDNGQVRQLNEEKKALQSSLKSGGLGQAQLRQPGAATAAVERRQTIQAQIDRIDDQLNSNALASKSEQRLAELDSQIAELKKDISTRPAELNPITAAIRRTEMNSVIGFSNPRSAVTILENANPAKAKALHAQVYLQSDEFAESVGGATKNEILMRAVAPQVADTTGVVKKVVDDKEEITRQIFSSQLGMAVKNTFNGLAYTEKELASARALKVNDYSAVSGMKINDAMSSFGGDGIKFEVNAVYTNGEGGWLKAEDAVQQAKISLRKNGVTDSDIEVLRRAGGEYEPVKLEDVRGHDGDYVVRVRLTEDIKAYDSKDWDDLDVKRNIFDYIETKGNNTWGSVNRHVFDAASTLHKQITGSLAIADDKAAKLSSAFTELFETKFSTPYTSLSKARRKAVDEYIKEANVKELKFDRAALATRFNDKELDILQGWRDSWDIMWRFENYDLVRSLQKDKFMLFDHANIRAVVRERPKRYDNRVVYDPAIDQVRKLTDSEIDAVYKNGGNIAEFRRPVDINNTTIEHMIVRNNGSEVARAFRDTDQMLEYREGYYQVFYKAARYIDETYEQGGKSYTRTIAVTDNIKDAKTIVEKLKAQNPDRSYLDRGDDRTISRSANSYWDMQHVGGRLAQRHRGQLLENSVGLKQMGAIDYIESPADSAVRAAHSIGGRLAMRETLEVAKQRFMNQYGELLRTEDGIKRFPATRDEISAKGEISSTRLADARTTWEYIRYMENGYINSMDEVFKNSLNAMADVAGLKGYDTVEKLMRAGADGSITGTVKGGVFAAMIASNPVRQFIVQPNQSLRMLAYNPLGMITGRVPSLIADTIYTRMRNQNFSGKTQEFYEWFKETGVEQAITRGNLIRGTMLEASDRYTTAGAVADATVGTLRRYGYDYAENLNLLVHGAYIYDRYKQGGKNILDARVREEMHSELRAITGNMNFAGDMPYNQNFAALLFTYMQVPHKFLLQSANRQLSGVDRAKLLVADLTFWGLPTKLIYDMVNEDLPVEDAWMREFLNDGLQSVILNGMASAITGTKQQVDYSSLAPFGLESWGYMFENALFEGGIKGMIQNTPTARVFGMNADSRLGMALKTTASFFRDVFEVEGDYIPVEFRDVSNAWLSMSSGWTNFQKARAAWMFGQMKDKQGRLTDDEVTHWEAFNQGLGFGTKDAAAFYDTMKIKNDAKEQAKSDVKAWAQMIAQTTANDPTRARSIQMWSQLMASTGWKPSMEYHREYMAVVQDELAMPANNKIMEKLFSDVINRPDPSNLRDPIKNANLPPEDEARFLEVYDLKRKRLEALQKQAEEELKRK